jgi:hypothetical protein
MKNTASPGFFVFSPPLLFSKMFPELLCPSSGPGEGWYAAGLRALGAGVSSQLRPRVPPGNLGMKGSGVALGSLVWTGK